MYETSLLRLEGCPCTAGDVLMGPNILSQVADVYRKLRFTLRCCSFGIHFFIDRAHKY